jgi:hypothetical protein
MSNNNFHLACKNNDLKHIWKLNICDIDLNQKNKHGEFG